MTPRDRVAHAFDDMKPRLRDCSCEHLGVRYGENWVFVTMYHDRRYF